MAAAPRRRAGRRVPPVPARRRRLHAVNGLSPLDRQARRRERRRQELVRWGIRAGVILVVFALGIALGEALHDNPSPGDSITLERTISLPTVPPGSTITP